MKSLQVKLKNKRIALGKGEDGNFYLRCKRLDDAGKSVVVTKIKFSEESMDAIFLLYETIKNKYGTMTVQYDGSVWKRVQP